VLRVDDKVVEFKSVIFCEGEQEELIRLGMEINSDNWSPVILECVSLISLFQVINLDMTVSCTCGKKTSCGVNCHIKDCVFQNLTN
jgi:hypothetical protein